MVIYVNLKSSLIFSVIFTKQITSQKLQYFKIEFKLFKVHIINIHYRVRISCIFSYLIPSNTDILEKRISYYFDRILIKRDTFQTCLPIYLQHFYNIIHA